MMKPSTPSEPQGRPNDPAGSTPPWPIPEPADVISYAYLWAREQDAGIEEGLKDRPVVVVVARIVTDARTELLVAPITHSEPVPGEGVRVPPPIKRSLGLDAEPSWIVTTEMNRFVWPGPDVRAVKSEDTPLHGAIPADLYELARTEIVRNARRDKVRMPKRSE